MMKVLFLTSKFEEGGISNVVLNEAKFLNKDFNIETTIATLNIKIDFHEDAKIVKIEDNYELKKLIENHDIIHVLDGIPILLRLKKLNLRKPLITTFHGFPPWYMHQGVRDKIEVLMLKLLYPRLIKKLANKVVATSGFVKRQLSNWGISSEIIYPGIDHSIFKPSYSKLDHSYIKLLYVGSAYKYKSVLEMVKAVGYLIKQKNVANIRLYLRLHVKKWDYFKIKEYVRKYQLENNMIILDFPYTTPNQLAEIYNKFCDIFITPSKWEGFGLPVIEAMACKKPIVARNIPIFQEIVKPSNAGILLNEFRPENLYKAISNIYNNYEQYSYNALKYSYNFDWRTHSLNLLNVYKSLSERI
jgi:glycosyltransferase involved in cell wall biosynthesis